MSSSTVPAAVGIDTLQAASDWLARARAAVASGSAIDSEQLDELAALLAGRTKVRQRLLYMHLTTPAPHAQALTCTIFDPSPGAKNELSAEGPTFAYNSVVEAMADGWQVISFPDVNAPIDDREVDMLGFLFILQKLEAYRG